MPWRPNLTQLAEEIKNAPSIFNSQPWFFELSDDDRIDLYFSLDGRHATGEGLWDPDPANNGAALFDPLAREFVISCGAALYNLRLAIRMAGHDLAVRLPPHPTGDRTLLASVEIMTGRVKAPTVAEQELYEAMWRRHTNRWPDTIVPAPLPIIVEMENAAVQEGATLRLLHPRQRQNWLDLAAEADRFFEAGTPKGLSGRTRKRYRTHQDYRARWIRVQADVGVPARTFGPTPKTTFVPTPENTFGPIPQRWKPTRKDFWHPDLKQRFERPQLMVLSTGDDELLDWLRAGQALQHAILTGTRFSISPPYGLAAKYHAPYRDGLPGRHHLVRRWRHDLAYDGLSVSLLTQPFERYDILRFGTSQDAALRPRPLPWRYAELPQVVIRVGYAVHPAGAAPRRSEQEQIIKDVRR